jgi:zinc transport system substrate-binding protein
MRISVIFLNIAVAAAILTAPAQLSAQPQGKGQIRVLCSTFPMYLFTRTVTAGCENAKVSLMASAAAGCPHDYMLTPQDMQKIAAADVFIANGLGLEQYLGEPLKKANPKIVMVDTSAGIGNLIELKEENEEQTTTDHKEAGEDKGDHHHAGPNPHLFACPRLAARIVGNIAGELGKIDPAGTNLYKKNADRYAAKLDALADEFAAAMKKSLNKKIVTEHAVFDYLARDCGLEIAAVVEENPGQEPSASKMLELIKIIKARNAAAIFTEPQYPAKVSRTLAKETGIPAVVLDPAASGPDDPPPDYYEKTMRANLDTLIKTLIPKAK